MKKLSDKSKKSLTIAGIGLVCVVVIIGISYQLKAKGVNGADAAAPSSTSSEVTVPAIGTDNHTSSTVPDSTAAVSSQAPATSSKANQVIQPDVSKPTIPSSKPTAQGSTTNPSKTPTYSSKDTSPSKASEPSGGETKDGKVYLPGFGWVTNTGGSGSSASDMYENGNKVGKMD